MKTAEFHWTPHYKSWQTGATVPLQRGKKRPNGLNVAIWALLEAGRDDLAPFLFGEETMESNGVALPHFDPGEAEPPSMDDMALIERAMHLGFHSVGMPYTCTGCEAWFVQYGIRHDGSVQHDTLLGTDIGMAQVRRKIVDEGSR